MIEYGPPPAWLQWVGIALAVTTILYLVIKSAFRHYVDTLEAVKQWNQAEDNVSDWHCGACKAPLKSLLEPCPCGGQDQTTPRRYTAADLEKWPEAIPEYLRQSNQDAGGIPYTPDSLPQQVACYKCSRPLAMFIPAEGSEIEFGLIKPQLCFDCNLDVDDDEQAA